MGKPCARGLGRCPPGTETVEDAARDGEDYANFVHGR